MYQTNLVKGVVFSDPKVGESETVFYLRQNNPIEGRPDDHRLFLVHFKGKKTEVADLKKGNEVFVIGEMLGDQYGRPFLREKPNGEIYTVFELETFRVYRDNEHFAFTLLMGNLGKDPDSRYLNDENATMVTSATFATNKSWRAGGEWQKSTIWWRLSTWRETAERAMNVWRKGLKLFIFGVLTYDSATGGPRIWERDTDDGKIPTASYEVNAYKYISLQKSENGNGDSGPMPMETEDEIPF